MKVITSKKNNVMPLKRKVAVLRKMMILKIVKRMGVLMEMLMSQRSCMKHGVVFLCPLMRVKLWESSLQRYMKQREAKYYT